MILLLPHLGQKSERKYEMDLHGNSIWNNATPNSEKAVMLTTKENLESVTKALDESGVNYCFFVRDNSVAIAIAKIAVEQSEIENLRKISEIEKLTVQKPRSNYSPKSSVIGNTPYKDIQNRHYQRLETDLALKVANVLNENSIPFSGRIYGKTVTLTVDSSNRRELERIISDVVAVRNSYKKKIENINNVVKAFADLPSEQQLLLQPLVDRCYSRGELFSETLVSELNNIIGLSPKQTQQFTDVFTDTYGSLNESEYIFADRKNLSDLFELFKTENFVAKLTENKAYSEEQLGLISQMVDLNWGNDILERVLDESFSPHSMELLLTAMKDNASYDNIIQIVAEAKNRNEAEVRDMLDVGYVPPLSPVDLYLQQGNGNMRNVLKQLIAFDSVSEYQKRLVNGEDSISVVKELFVPASRLKINDNGTEIGEISISAQEDSVLFSGSERTVSYTWGIIAGFFDILAKENLDYEKFRIADTAVLNTPKGSIYTIPLNTTDELLERLEQHGVVPKDEKRDIVFETDNGSWNRLIIPDSYGNKYNNIDISEVLTPEEMSVVKTVINDVIKQEQAKDRAKQVAQEQKLPFSAELSNGLDDKDDSAVYNGSMSLFDFDRQQLFQKLDEIVNTEGNGKYIPPIDLLEAFDGAAMDDWEHNAVKQNRIKAALNSILHGEIKTEDCFVAIAQYHGADIERKLTEKEQFFQNCVISALLAKSTLAWDEIESLGIIFYDDSYIDRFHSSDNVIFGNGMREPDVFSLSKRIRQGEDISKELALGLLGSKTTQGRIQIDENYTDEIEFDVEQSGNALSLSYGSVKREITYQELAQSYLTLFQNEYQRYHRINHLDEQTQENQNQDRLEFAFGDGEAPALVLKNGKWDGWFTESELLHEFVLNTEYLGGTKISFALANALIEYLDEKQHTERTNPDLQVGWYDKTNFSVKAKIGDDEFNYSGRFDIGDGQDNGGGSLINHIRAFTQNQIERNPLHLSKEKIDGYQRNLDILIPFLEKHSALTAEEQKLLDDFKQKHPIISSIEVDRNNLSVSDLTDKAKNLINDFVTTEYELDTADYSDLSNIEVAFTETEDGLHTIQSAINLNDFRITTSVDGLLVRTEQYKSLEDMVENVLPYLDFGELVYVSDEELEIAKNKYKIYQLKDDESNRFKRFESLSNQSEPVNVSDYQLVYEGSLLDIEGSNKLEGLFVKFNTDRPDDFKGHSLSVSDVIVTEIDGEETAYYCDSVGFPELPDFFKDKYQVIEENRRNSIHQAFEAVRENHKFSGEQNKWIDRFEKEAVKRNGFDLSLFERGAFKNAGGFRGIDNRAFNGQLGDILHELSPVFKEPDVLDEIDTEGIRLELENSGIVNGEVVDADKLNNNPFIRRVTADVEAVEHSQNDSETGIASSSQKAENFRITDNEIGSGTTMQRFRNNLSAIRTLKELEADGRQATPEEQETLSRYVGWGGLAEFFKEGNPHYQELRDLLTEDEYSSARATTLDSFYTSPVIIDSIYTVLQNSGFEGGYILEPSMGIGNFFGRMPQEMQEHSKLYGVEIDGLTGRIAKQLYPLAHIDIKGFEKTKFKDNSFDVAVGNIPFGDFSLQYDKQSLKIHDYFFMQALDKVKDGGIVAFVTSKGTLDKRDSSFRKQLAEKADLIGAIRLPNNAFKSAGTEVTADIVFLQKRQSPPEKTPDWVNIGINSAGLPINEYFVQHPDMILGEIVQGNKMFGRSDDTMCVPFENVNLSELLPEAVSKIKADYNADRQAVIPVVNDEIPIPENTRNYSYFEYNNNIYNAIDGEAFSLKSSWKRSYSAANIERAKAYIQIRETVRELLSIQQDTSPDVEDRIKELQAKLNTQYDSFYKKYGLMHSRFNAQLFRDDSSYPLMLSLEDKIDKDKLLRKSDIFYKRTIRVPQVVESVDTPQEALALSLAEKGRVDIGYMSELTDIPAEDIIKELKGEIFPVPELSNGDNIVYQTSSEYLSGDIYTKLSIAQNAAESNNVFEGNISALEAAVPTPLTAGEIDIECGATWIPKEIYQQFMYETFKTPNDLRADRPARYPWQQKRNIEVEYSPITNKWNITNKSADHSVTTQKTFGTKVKAAYHILESVLNLHTPNITKIVPNPNNPNETMKVMDIEATKLVKKKAEAIKAEFKEWVFKDPERRRTLVEMYNRQFNCIRPREYDGSHLQFHGMNASIELHQHQKNAIAHAIYGGNTLFAHCVGAGKTFEMIATAMESKRLGLCSKSLFAVPNHLTEQVGADFMKLYPNANILVATKKDFTKQNRSKLLAKIATGNYDAVIIGHSQLGMIPISPDRQERIYRDQIDDITEGIRQLKEEQGGSFQVKQMERTKKDLQAKLEKLNNLRKDNTVYFEELGVDKLFVDEAHEFKNLMSVTKLQNVSGISGRTSQRATDLFMKCRYLDEKTGGKGVVFATGTPVSNSVTELHTMMRYLQYDFLNDHGLQNFDNWVSVFGKQKTEYELAPTGDKFKARTRIASYANMPELMTMFKQCADVRTSDSLNLPVPDCELHIVNAEPTQLQQDMVAELSARADDVQSGAVDPTEDNMLKITGDGRKVGLDPRLVDPTLEDNPNTKLNQCVNNVYQIWQDTADKKLTQIIFCDLGVPKPNQQADSGKEADEQSMAEIDSLEECGVFCVYDDIKNKLAEMGVPKSEVAFIHEAKTELQKSELFEKVRSGEVRVLIGSTAKMGTGTNVQDRLIALHDLDVPWRPADLEQRRGRMVRQGNINDNVHLYRYVTKGTFDAYSYQLLETKQRFISQVITSKTPARTCTDVDQEALTYSEIKALCTGDERIKEKLTLENRVKELRLFKKEYDSTHFELEDKVAAYPQKREVMCDRISRIEQDFEKCRAIPLGSDGLPVFKIKIKGVEYSDKKEAAEALKKACGIVYSDKGKAFEIGEINGFKISAYYDHFNECIQGKITGEAEYTTPFSTMPSVNVTKLERLIVGIEKVLNEARKNLAQADIDIQSANEILAKPFEHAQELKQKTERLTELTDELNAEAANRLQTAEKPQRTHYFGKAMILSNKRKGAPAQAQERSVEQDKNKTSDIAL